ncbi:Choline transporter-like protein 1 [Anthophora quadrimaculata]
MGCCGCSDEPSSKVEPGTPEHEGMSSRHSEQVFVTDRSCTDILAMILLIGLAVGFGFLVTDVVKKGDIYRVINGYDDCANVCGRVTPHETDPKFSCKGADKTKERYLLMTVDANGVKSRQCVVNCTDQHMTFLNRCINKQVHETATSIIRKLGLENFYKKKIPPILGGLQGYRCRLEGTGLSVTNCFSHLVGHFIRVPLHGAMGRLHHFTRCYSGLYRRFSLPLDRVVQREKCGGSTQSTGGRLQ